MAGQREQPRHRHEPAICRIQSREKFVGKQGVCIVLKLLKGKRKWALLFLPVTAAILLLVSVANPSFAGSTETQRRAFLGQYGWELGEEIIGAVSGFQRNLMTFMFNIMKFN